MTAVVVPPTSPDPGDIGISDAHFAAAVGGGFMGLLCCSLIIGPFCAQGYVRIAWCGGCPGAYRGSWAFAHANVLRVSVGRACARCCAVFRSHQGSSFPSHADETAEKIVLPPRRTATPRSDYLMALKAEVTAVGKVFPRTAPLRDAR
eukprot:TRINITY_DN1935_c0_g1_i1.p1 TRINITY_DN1935_c0_g1~~TRINITY_DN1935_c0_g1_i1.p1  ORF type:complete len:148 (-),score=4.31 TRINITY_DN1935_c0_g1_i1:95-538(-)